MNTNCNIEHLVLKIQNDENTLSFYNQFFNLLGYTKDFESENYINYTNQIIPIGLYFERWFVESPENSCGLGHLAWKTNSKETISNLSTLIEKFKLEFETLGEDRTHHNQQFYTCCFYCPSGNRLELILV